MKSKQKPIEVKEDRRLSIDSDFFPLYLLILSLFLIAASFPFLDFDKLNNPDVTKQGIDLISIPFWGYILFFVMLEIIFVICLFSFKREYSSILYFILMLKFLSGVISLCMISIGVAIYRFREKIFPFVGIVGAIGLFIGFNYLLYLLINRRKDGINT